MPETDKKFFPNAKIQYQNRSKTMHNRLYLGRLFGTISYKDNGTKPAGEPRNVWEKGENVFARRRLVSLRTTVGRVFVVVIFSDICIWKTDKNVFSKEAVTNG